MRRPSVTRNIGWNFVIGPLVLIGNLAVVAIGVRVAGPEAFGVWAICFSAATLGSQLDFGFGTAYIRYSAKLQSEGDEGGVILVRQSGLVVFAGLGVLAGLTIAGFLSLYFSINQPPMAWASLVGLSAFCVCVGFLSRYFVAILQSDQRFLPERVTSLLSLAIKLAVLLPVITETDKLGRVVLADCLGLLIMLLGSIACVIAGGYEKSFRPILRSPVMKPMLRFGSTAFVGTASGLVAMQMPMYVVGAACGYQDVAVFSALSRIASSSRITFSWVTGPLLPHLARGDASPESSNRNVVFDRSVVVLGCITATYVSLLVGCGDTLLKLWLGPDLQGYGPLAATVGVYVFCSAMYALLAVYAIARGKPRLVAQQGAVGLVGTCVLAVWLVPQLGVIGAGIALVAPSAALWLACALAVASNFRLSIGLPQSVCLALLVFGSASSLAVSELARGASLDPVAVVLLCAITVVGIVAFVAAPFFVFNQRRRKIGRHRLDTARAGASMGGTGRR